MRRLALVLALVGCHTAGGSSPGTAPGGAPPSLQRYLDLPRATAPSLSRDGRTLAFLSDVPGLPQPYTVPTPVAEGEASAQPPTGPAGFQRLPSAAQRVQLVHLLADGTHALLGHDQGGDENTQFARLDLPSGRLDELTAKPAVKHLFGAVDPTGNLFAYSTNERNKRDFDVVLRDLRTSAPPRLLYEGKGQFEPRAISPDGALLLLVEQRSGAEQLLHRVLLPKDATSTPSVEALTPSGEPARFVDACFLAGAVLTLSDRSSEYLGLDMIFPSAGAAPQPLIHESLDIDVLACSPSGDRFALGYNVQGRHQLKVFKVARSAAAEPNIPFPLPVPLPTNLSLELVQGLPPEIQKMLGLTTSMLAQHGRSALIATAERHELPPGVIRAMTFSGDGSELAVQLGRATEPDQVWTIHTDTGKTRQRTQAGAELAKLPRVEPELATVKSFDGQAVPVFVYKPAGLGAGQRAPSVVWVHGGPESQYQPSFSPLIQALVARGYVVAAPNVRGSTGYGKRYSHLDDVAQREDSVRDLAAVNQWLRGRDDIDAGKIAVMGGSYGGYMVLAALTLDPDLWSAGIDVVGIANFRTFLEKTASYRRAQREAEYGSLERDGELLDRISPIHRVDRIKAPLFVIHGANDPRVPVAEAEQIVAALQKRQQPVTYLRFDDEGHGLSKRANQLAAYTKVIEFLDGVNKR